MVGDSSSFNIGWEELFENSPAEKRPPDSILGAIDDCVTADTESLLLAAYQLFEPPTCRFGVPRSVLEIAQVEDSRIPKEDKGEHYVGNQDVTRMALNNVSLPVCNVYCCIILCC